MQNSGFSFVHSAFIGAILLLALAAAFALVLPEKQPPGMYENPPSPVQQSDTQADTALPTDTKEETDPGQPEDFAPITATSAQEKYTMATSEVFEESQQGAKPQVSTVQKPPLYNTPPVSFDTVNETILPALVNILCGSTSNSNITGMTGSGIVIDPRGVILTNAHVAQYLLLQNHPSKPVACVVRVGSPAKIQYTAEILAFPQAWAEQHGKDLFLKTPTGTGEHDWALLYITGRTDGSEKPSAYPFVPFDPRYAIVETGDPVLLASYPADFVGSIVIREALWPVSTITRIQKVYTFTQSAIDVLSLGGTIVAQRGSSGGAVLNQWGKLVGLIVTSSVGDTTDDRDLRAITMAHVSNSMQEQTGSDLNALLELGNFPERAKDLKEKSTPLLLELFPL
ncbi:hypothetical protein CL652_00810 [bacterium]|nr:hypothetical protein [bacterium]|tara:strand:+ start:279 stop:1469 length:1191 start_codon:yes stop_codon:yes gene_type:complete